MAEQDRRGPGGPGGANGADGAEADGRYGTARDGRHGAPTGGPPEALVPYRKPQPRPRLRLLCFPHGGGSASLFRSWQPLIGEEVEVWGVQLPGREGRRHESPYRSIAEAVAELAESLGPHLDLPFGVYGHSVGADLAYGLSVELAERGLPTPRHLFVAGQTPPYERVVEDPLHLLPDAELLARLEQYGGIPGELRANREALEPALPRLRADLELSETYALKAVPRLDVPVTAFGGLHDRTLHTPDIARWAELTAGAFHVEWLPGGHFFAHTEVEEVVEQIHDTLVFGPHGAPEPGAAAQVAAAGGRFAGTRAGSGTGAPAREPVRPAATESAPPAPSVAQEPPAAQEPSTAQELTAVLAEVAPAHRIGLDDNFFDAGLSSIALVRLQDALTQRGYGLEITDFFRWPTVRRLAAALHEQRAAEAAE